VRLPLLILRLMLLVYLAVNVWTHICLRSSWNLVKIIRALEWIWDILHRYLWSLLVRIRHVLIVPRVTPLLILLIVVSLYLLPIMLRPLNWMRLNKILLKLLWILVILLSLLLSLLHWRTVTYRLVLSLRIAWNVLSTLRPLLLSWNDIWKSILTLRLIIGKSRSAIVDLIRTRDVLRRWGWLPSTNIWTGIIRRRHWLAISTCRELIGNRCTSGINLLLLLSLLAHHLINLICFLISFFITATIETLLCHIVRTLILNQVVVYFSLTRSCLLILIGLRRNNLRFSICYIWFCIRIKSCSLLLNIGSFDSNRLLIIAYLTFARLATIWIKFRSWVLVLDKLDISNLKPCWIKIFDEIGCFVRISF